MARPTAPAPAHLLPLALILLIWHGLLGLDYVLQRFALAEPGWPALMPLMPLDTVWMQVAWAMGVWLGLIAALFLLLKDDASVLLFFAAAVAEIVVGAGMVLYAPPVLMLPVSPWLIVALLVAAPLIGWLYARAQNRHGVLH